VRISLPELFTLVLTGVNHESGTTPEFDAGDKAVYFFEPLRGIPFARAREGKDGRGHPGSGQ
jgi:hypothetical protein